ncbi:hypothetical protein [Paenibacillus humicola]|uniref:hypothetical protein n=1 Tax=Paenibacillus humicola TaxID=3110540 RepID=UPI00237AB453|nr:hypothetical protein [Paenibacillus humicola]
MKNSRYYPFERNRYFYGKLLTVRDFESEQKYISDKRRLMNRLLIGSGVVSGMQVVAVDDKSITVEMGVAIDYSGREIVIPSPVTLKLSMIDGFTNNEYKKNVFLYIAYDEKGKEPVHAIANSAVRSEEVSEYNRILESYRLFIKEEAPAPDSFENVRLTEVIAPIYQDGQVRIYQRMPKYVNPEAIADVTLVVEKTLQTPKISLAFDYECDGFTPVGDERGTVVFSEPGDGQDTEFTYTYSVKAANTAGRKAKLSVNRASVKLSIGDLRIAVDSNPVHEVDIIQEPAAERSLRDYFERTLDESLDGMADQEVCLAKISLLQMGPTYMIEHVDRVPFGEYVYNPSFLQRLGIASGRDKGGKFFVRSEAAALPFGRKPTLDVDYNEERSEFSFKLGVPQPQHIQDEMSTGTVTVELELNAKSGPLYFFFRGQKNYVTDEIDSGLGSGPLYVMVGLEDMDAHVTSDLLQSSDQVYYGSADVFKGTAYEPQLPAVTFGTIVYPAKGTFRIGMKLSQGTETPSIKLRWWAFKKLPGTGPAAVVRSAAGAGDGAGAGAAQAAAGRESENEERRS